MSKRRWVQVLSLLALHASWGPELKWLCNPVLSCHSCALAWFACPIGVLVHYSGYHLFPFLAVGTLLLVGALVGRLLCGWVCPFGFLQDLLYKIPSRKFALPAWTSNIKYGVLFFGVVLLPFLFGESTLYSFCRVCPAAAVQVSLPGLISGGFAMPAPATLMRFGVLAAVLGLAVVSSRSFCRVLCPIAAILGPLNRLSFWSVRAPAGCRDCGLCDRACPVDGQPSERMHAGVAANREAECLVCHDCRTACAVVKREQQGHRPDADRGRGASPTGNGAATTNTPQAGGQEVP